MISAANDNFLHPSESVAIGSGLLDLNIVNDKGFVVGRPWVTVGMSIYCPLVWGLTMSLEPPCKGTIIETIVHGVCKRHSQESHGNENDWSVYGLPNKIILEDPFVREPEIIEFVVAKLGISLEINPQNLPQKEFEGFFSSLNCLFKKYISVHMATLSNTAVTITEFKNHVVRYIADKYQHTSINFTPT